jgi:hypothetical protein
MGDPISPITSLAGRRCLYISGTNMRGGGCTSQIALIAFLHVQYTGKKKEKRKRKEGIFIEKEIISKRSFFIFVLIHALSFFFGLFYFDFWRECVLWCHWNYWKMEDPISGREGEAG